MDELKFYDMKAKKPFVTDDYRIVTKGKRKFAVAEGPSGNEVWRIIGSK